jgi:hypothetical protein
MKETEFRKTNKPRPYILKSEVKSLEKPWLVLQGLGECADQLLGEFKHRHEARAFLAKLKRGAVSAWSADPAPVY